MACSSPTHDNWTIDVFGIAKLRSRALPAPERQHGALTDNSSLITTASGNSYEAEIGDLDGDNDLVFLRVAQRFRRRSVKKASSPEAR
jgi:hypothetical protein